MPDTLDEDFLELADEADGQVAPGTVWHILIVDDDEDVHAATEFSLSGAVVRGRSLLFHHARSAEAAIGYLESRNDIDLVLLDMVMERPDSGLAVAHWLRETARRLDIPTIVLRSGQPGMLAGDEVRRNPHIDAFIEKQHATRARLIELLERFLRERSAP